MNPLESTEQKNQKKDSKRYRYCCRKCKHTEKGKKSCVCVVPMNQRRAVLGDIGCQTCSCKGCSVEDYLSRGEDPQYKPQKMQRSRSREEDKKNLCCRKCSKHYSKSRKPCICHASKQKRKGKMPIGGCKICGCQGCNMKQYSDDSYSSRSRSRSKYSSSVSQNYDEFEYNFNNVERSTIGKIVVVEYNMNPALLGLGIPQRTPSYILGKPI